MTLIIVITSKNSKSINRLIKILNKNLKSTLFSGIQINQRNTKSYRKIYTFVKSPHVFSRSKEHIGFQEKTKSFQIKSCSISKIVLLFKKIHLVKFKDIKCKYKIITSTSKSLTDYHYSRLNPDGFILSRKLPGNYLRLFDQFGETSFNSKPLHFVMFR